MVDYVQIDGSFQIKQHSVSVTALNDNFLNSGNWKINGTSNTKHTITTIPDPINEEDASNKRYVDTKISIAPPNITFYDHQTLGAGISGALNGVNKIFTLDHIPYNQSVNVYINGLIQDPDAYQITLNEIQFAPQIELTQLDTLIISYHVF